MHQLLEREFEQGQGFRSQGQYTSLERVVNFSTLFAAICLRVGVNRAFEGKRVELLTEIEKAQRVLTRAVCGGQLQPLSHKLPGVEDTRLQREPGFVEIPQFELARGQKRLDKPRPNGCCSSSTR